MKNKIQIFFSLIILVSLSSCSLFVENDTTGNVSYVSIKPVVTLLGDPIMSIKVGDTYVDAGVEAYAGDTVLYAEIISGAVDDQKEGFYVVTYEATNGFGWKTTTYRTVLVHDGTPYQEDIGGTYKKGFNFETTVSKYSILGYWKMENVFQEEGVEFPIVFADMGDGVNYNIVPDEHPTKGSYSGVGVRTGNVIKFTLTTVDGDGVTTVKNFDWTKQ